MSGATSYNTVQTADAQTPMLRLHLNVSRHASLLKSEDDKFEHLAGKIPVISICPYHKKQKRSNTISFFIFKATIWK